MLHIVGSRFLCGLVSGVVKQIAVYSEKSCSGRYVSEAAREPGSLRKGYRNIVQGKRSHQISVYLGIFFRRWRVLNVKKRGKAMALVMTILLVSESLILWPPSMARQNEVKLVSLGAALPLSLMMVVLPSMATEGLWRDVSAADGSFWGRAWFGTNKGYWARDQTGLPVTVNTGYWARDV